MSQFNNIVKVQCNNKEGSAFILPSIDKENMFLITATHLISNGQNLNEIKVLGFDNLYKEIKAIDYIRDEYSDLCVLKVTYDDTYLSPIISEPYEEEITKLVGFPKNLSSSDLCQHSLINEIKEIKNSKEIYAIIKDNLSSFIIDEHELIEGFSGGAFISNLNNKLYFLGIETSTVTEEATYGLIKGISGLYIVNFIFDNFYKEINRPLTEFFNIQNTETHFINVSNDECIESFRKAVNSSLSSISYIDDVLGKDFELDRSDIINKIKESDYQFISLYGEAGSGKSALAKKIVKNDHYVLYSRAENFLQEKSLYNIWGFDIEKFFKLISNVKVTFFIDALEFIADRSGKMELLYYLYEIINKHKNGNILTTCRTSDKSAFFPLESKYTIKPFEVKELSDKDLNSIFSAFPIINTLKNSEFYAQLLKSPFYINIVIRNNFDINNINDENSFRDLIFKEAICLKSKLDRYSISFDEMILNVKKIVFTRAKEFSVGVHKEEINSDILNILISEGVVIVKNDYARLSYDIFEDIVFEREFDKLFTNSRGDYNKFYESIEEYGRCVYRRYQIWISNKLFLKNTRDRFINKLIFNDLLTSEWTIQTIIGIVKSQYCSDFFDEYQDELISSQLLITFIEVINLYSFSPKIISNNNTTILKLLPIGNARGKIIGIVEKEKIYMSNEIDNHSIIKLCYDYSNLRNRNIDFSHSACKIIEYMVDVNISNGNNRHDSIIYSLLNILYNMADVCSSWIENFFEKLRKFYNSKNSDKKIFSEDIIRFTLKNTTPVLAKNVSEKLSELAYLYWKVNNNEKFYYNSFYECTSKYGLSKNAENYNYEFRAAESNLFYIYLLTENFNVALLWTIDFVNQAMDRYFEDYSPEESKLCIYFSDDNTTRNYYACSELWLMGIQENYGHKLLCDMIYLLKNLILSFLEQNKNDTSLFNTFSRHVKEILYSKSNNIALLTIIEAIGFHYQKELPGFALDLASSVELIYMDIERYSFYNPSNARTLLENQIFTSMGIPRSLIKDRYKKDEKCSLILQQYVLSTYHIHDALQHKCNSICDYLYARYPNNKLNANANLQIQKMDGRNSSIEDMGNGYISISTQIIGEAEFVVKNHEKNNAQMSELQILLEKCDIKQDEKINYDYVDKSIDYIINLSDEKEKWKIELEDFLITLICIMLKNKNTSEKRRNELCDFWLNKLFKIFNNEAPVVQVETISILFEQLKYNISEHVKNRIKKFILLCTIDSSENGIIKKYENYVKEYLITDSRMAKLVFITILMLANKENSKRNDEIIDLYLLKEQDVEFSEFNIKEYDFNILISITNCGLELDDKDFYNVICCLLQMIDIQFKNNVLDRNLRINITKINKMTTFLQRELHSNRLYSKAIDILFDNVELENPINDRINFYYDTFNYMLSSFFDGHSNKQIRKNIKNAIKYLENKINNINDENVKIILSKPLVLFAGRFDSGDWSELKTSYSYNDIDFLNKQIVKYGKFHFSDVLYSLYKLQLKELLPDILTSVNHCITELSSDENQLIILMDNKDTKFILEDLILKSYVEFSDRIKEEKELSDAFESILEKLISIKNEKAAVILDEYRIH